MGVRDDADQRIGQGAPGERQPTVEHLIENDAERKDVAAGIEGPRQRLLRRHVLRRAEKHVRSREGRTARGERARQVLGQAEIDDLRTARRNDDVLRFDVAVDNSRFVRGRQRPRDVANDAHQLGLACRPE